MCHQVNVPLSPVGELGAPLGGGSVVLPLALRQGCLGMDVPLGAASPKPFFGKADSLWELPLLCWPNSPAQIRRGWSEAQLWAHWCTQVPAAALSRRRCWPSFETLGFCQGKLALTDVLGTGDSDTKSILTKLPGTAPAAGPWMAGWGGWVWGPEVALGVKLWGNSSSWEGDAVRGRGVRSSARIFLSCV